jgi:hypothetical protein
VEETVCMSWRDVEQSEERDKGLSWVRKVCDME